MEVGSSQVYRSISSALTHAAIQLTANKDASYRSVGEALLQAEPLGHYEHEDADHIRYRGRLSIRLGFYSEAALAVVRDHESVAASAITAATVGPMAPSVQVTVEMLSEEWHMRRFEPEVSTSLHLNRLLDANEVLQDPKRAIILRRLRYRLGNDHNWEPEHSNDLIVWSTPTTKSWATSISNDTSRLGRVADVVSNRVGERGASTDWAEINPNDWGAVLLEQDPIRVLEVTTKSGVTATEVKRVLDAASSWLKVLPPRHTSWSTTTAPIDVFARELGQLADDVNLADRVDVALCHRGGGLHPSGHRDSNVSDADRESLLAAALRVRDLGIEVVFGLGHGDVSVLPKGTDEVGIYEATTPTAAASWLVNEHVSTLLVDQSLALGQD